MSRMSKQDKTKILVIEDDATMREGIQTVLEKDGYPVLSAADGIQGSSLFRSESPKLAIIDLKLPGKSGMHLLHEFLEVDPNMAVILISAYGTIDLAVSALKSGARDFIAKPFSIDELRAKVSEVLKNLPLPQIQMEAVPTFYGMVGSSAGMSTLKERILQAGKVSSAVLISGESGTGKELIARAIHAESKRKDKVFLAVNCGAFTDTLLESELFGHEKGSFTGAIREHHGIFEQADQGTILLDEIGDVSPQLQVKLLRVLQHQSFQRLGGTETISTDVRIITATNRNLAEAVRNKEFREDLYFRLNVLPIVVPPLRERSADIPELIDYLMEIKCRNLDMPKPMITAHAIEKLQAYSWPGNIRELENLLERVLIFSEGATIEAGDIFFDEPIENNAGISGTLPEVLEDTEYKMIKSALAKAGGVKQKAARMLGIKTSTLYYKMEKYGLFEHQDSPDS